MIVFVTGSTGFVGKVFLTALLRHLGPHDVVRVLVRKPFESTDARLQPVIGDLLRVDEWVSALRDVNWVFHLGANATFGDGGHYHEVNAEPVRQMLAALADSSVLNRFVFISTIGAVDRSPQDRIRSPLTPQSLPHPTSDYGASKLAAEELVRESGLPYTTIRPGWVYGAGMRSESHLKALAAVVFRSPWIASLAFPGRVPLIHVSDFAHALVRCIDMPESANRTYIAVSENRTVGEIVALFHNALHGSTRRQLAVPCASRIVKRIHAWLPLKVNVLFSDYLAAIDAAFTDALLPPRPIRIDNGLADIVAEYGEPKAWWIITGANSGIGLALTQALALRGKPVIAVDRRVDQLTESEFMQVLRADLGNPSDIEQVAAAVKPKKLAGLVNNAGIGFKGSYMDTPSERHEATVAVNVLAPLRLTHALLPQLQRSQATIVNIASSVAYHPLPGMATYAASKAFILSWSLALGDELRRTNHVVTFSPSGTKTQFQISGGVKGSEAAGLHDPQDVASAVLRAVDRRKRHTLFGWKSRLLVCASRFLPTTQRLTLWRLLFSRLR